MFCMLHFAELHAQHNENLSTVKCAIMHSQNLWVISCIWIISWWNSTEHSKWKTKNYNTENTNIFNIKQIITISSVFLKYLLKHIRVLSALLPRFPDEFYAFTYMQLIDWWYSILMSNLTWSGAKCLVI